MSGLSKQRILERLQTLQDVVEERYDSCFVKDVERLEELIELCFQTVCRRKKVSK